MKKTLVAVAAAACAMSGAAFAQSPSNVTLYGIADAGVSFQNHVNGGAN
ncbi:porin [Cupriavidus necator]|nr:porin [Cupriavidus necator]